MQICRLRRLREKSVVRDWASETYLSPKNIILPYFVAEGRGVKKEINSMPGIYRLSVDNLVKEIPKARGIKAVLLFGIPNKKDSSAKEAYKKDGLIQRAVNKVKRNFKDLVVITDVCLCGYTSHGHCGIARSKKPVTRNQKPEFRIDNDETLKILAKIALTHAERGADIVAPSSMMDGQVRTIREALDKNKFKDVGILAYSAKYASNFYGPFRDALDSQPQFGDRKSYQMDFRNSREALREIKQDIDEGADMVMVKPALSYLDIIYRAKEKFNIPIAAYNVSGEYSMIKALAAGDKIKEKELALETLSSIKRAGADFIISYFGKEIGRWLA